MKLMNGNDINDSVAGDPMPPVTPKGCRVRIMEQPIRRKDIFNEHSTREVPKEASRELDGGES